MSAVLEWTKRNIFIVIFAAVMIAALITLPVMAGKMNTEVRREVEKRAQKMNQLKQLERTPIARPGSDATEPGLVNERLLAEYQRSVEMAGGDAARVIEAAIAHNRKDYTVLNNQLFPEPRRDLREVLPRRFHEQLTAAYTELLTQVRAGSAPSLETMREELERRDAQIRLQFAKNPTDPLTVEEEKTLRDQLRELRMQKYQDAASAISMYLDRSVLEIPGWDPAVLPSLAQLYEWQWKYWIQKDVVMALSDANRGSRSVIDAPVKHVQFMRVLDHQVQAPRDDGSGDGGGAGEPMGPMGPIGPTGGDQPSQPGAAAPDDTITGPPMVPDLGTPVPPNYAASLTGRYTCAIYDVRYVDLDLVVDAARLPEVLDALARRNFITVTRMRLSPADPFEAAKLGYFYGPAPVANVSLRLETIWLRAWTAPFMPASVRRALGIQSQMPGGEDMG